MLVMWESLRQYVPAVFRRWWLSVTGIVAGLVWLVSLFVSIPAIPNWLWLTLFVVLLAAAQFFAFHQVRAERDGLETPGLTLLAQANWRQMRGYAYGSDANALLAAP